MLQKIKKLLYHPIHGRIAYDFCISFFLSGLLYVLFFVFKQNEFPVAGVITVPITVVGMFWLFGVYTAYKTEPIITKIIILGTAVIAAGLVHLLFIPLSLHFLLLEICIIFLTTTPRIFLNFKQSEYKKFSYTSEDENNGAVLVVGGGGYIGTAVVEQLLQKNYTVKVFDKFIYGKEVFAGLKNKKNLELLEGDISDIFALTVALKGVQSIIHLAGIVGDPAAALDEQLTRHVNTTSTRILKEAAKAFGIQRFIFASSCSVYGLSAEIVTEDSALHPVSLYAQTKIDSEKELLEDVFDYFHPTVLRFATVFGHSRKPRFDLVANLFVAQAFTNKKITVTNENQWRPFIHVTDVARAVITVLEAPISTVSRQVFNVGDDALNVTIGQLAQLVKNTVKNKKVEIVTTAVSSDKRNYSVSFARINEKLNFTHSVGLEQGLAEIYANFQHKKYTKKYTNTYYSNFEMTKILLKEFNSKKYQQTHLTSLKYA